MGNVRVLPLLVFAGLCLLGLKAMGLLLSGSYVLSGAAPASAQNQNATAAQQQAEKDQPAGKMPSAEKAGSEKKTAQVDAGKEKADMPAAPEGKSGKTAAKGKPGKKNIAPQEDERLKGGPNGGVSKSELAVLEGLANRRKELDTRVRELELRENLLKAAEKRIEAKITELKLIESRIESDLKQRDDSRNQQYERLVKIYSSMKPKDAARIFNRLDMTVLTGLVDQIKPRAMSAIMSSMSPEAAERLTLEIAQRGQPKSQGAGSLPKIRSQRTN